MLSLNHAGESGLFLSFYLSFRSVSLSLSIISPGVRSYVQRGRRSRRTCLLLLLLHSLRGEVFMER
ncbi:hypothetical protein CSUI_010824 [Cystoisospora suis]|uniref:Uncharacterized protein n=1 Tax=Cystoisospora suis TaxID=483139 RepID=A0A2C6KFW5_9APIC|nr:hypothetical protein CSUI_010824 [Cystoisospora suis]